MKLDRAGHTLGAQLTWLNKRQPFSQLPPALSSAEHQKQSPDQVNVCGERAPGPSSGVTQIPTSAFTICSHPACPARGFPSQDPALLRSFPFLDPSRGEVPAGLSQHHIHTNNAKLEQTPRCQLQPLDFYNRTSHQFARGHFSQTGLLLPNLLRICRYSWLPALGGTKRNDSNFTKSSTNQDVLSKDTDSSLLQYIPFPYSTRE